MHGQHNIKFQDINCRVNELKNGLIIQSYIIYAAEKLTLLTFLKQRD